MKTLFVFIAVASGMAFAQRKDEPIPFEDETPVAPLPKRQKPADADDFSGYVQYRDTEFEALAREDDPTVGISFEVHGGVLWLDESKKGSAARFAIGTRLTWEWSRTFWDDEYWRKVFFVDLTWNITQAKAGTELVYAKATHNYLVLAPAWSFPLGDGTFAFFVQGGIGFFILSSALTIDYQKPIKASNTGAFFLGQYSLGLRVRVALDPKQAMFLVFRTELSGYARRYAHDIMLSTSIGAGF